jgi:hypothetical protein
MEFVQQGVNHHQDYAYLKPMPLNEGIRGSNESSSGQEGQHSILREVSGFPNQEVDCGYAGFA